MKKFRDMKIRTKLTILIVIMIIGNVLIGGVGYIYNVKSNTAIKNMYSNNLLAIEKLSDIKNQVVINYSNILNLMITTDERNKAAMLEDYNARSEAIDKDFSEFKDINSSEEATKQAESIQNNLNDWNTTSKEIIDLVSIRNTDQAITKFEWEGQSIFEDLQKSIQDLENYNVEMADQIYQSNKDSGARAVFLIMVVIVAVSILCIALGGVITLTISNSIHKVVSLIKKTANLDFTKDTSYDRLISYKDEIGVIAKEIGTLRSIIYDMAKNILDISGSLAASSEELAASTEENTNTVRQVVTAVNEITKGNNYQAEMVDKTSESIKTVVTSIDGVNKETDVSSKNARTSMETVKEGQSAINLTMNKMKENIEMSESVGLSIQQLIEQMDEVGNIVNVIKDISEDTNLLSFNASIEAARAGEAGRGFAVVASEIGKLSNSTAESVNEVTNIISDAIEKSTATAENNNKVMKILSEQEKAINTTMEAFNKIKLSVENIADRTIKISERMNHIDISSRDISKSILDISKVAQDTAASSEEITASSDEQLASIEMIASAANELSTMATNLNNEISKFKL